ncbi:xanthine dehydrogenase family protein molybdopterin-binding subunit [uncultured Clostridium sp.]|uniref:xanthine dehydrogenase family protein molybdopterin-binding subunit n=1 Tax=uncultured Clostridium sp. TaxID=59620 RepID=UPI0025D85770|nr:xanthine dehydrogenase family protein molybdopterin-binding subunit [uncultured Clostridium sp.]
MRDIGKSVKKKDHDEKMSGCSLYIADIKFDEMIYGVMLRSTISYGKIKRIELPEMKDGYYVIGSEDVPGVNLLKVITSEQPIFAGDIVRYIGEGILMIAGPDKEQAQEYLKQVRVEYEEYKPILTIDEADENAAAYSYIKGNPEECFEKAAQIIEETFYTGYQEQAYLEPQGVVGIYKDGKVTVYGSMQCPYYVKNAVMYTMGLDEDKVQIIQTVTGGGFGGKEDYPSLIGCQAAVAAAKTGHPVQLILNRREDLAVTPKRHPGKLIYKAALDKNNNITAIDADIKLNAGAYAGLSSVVLQRSLIAASGVYNIENLNIRGSAVLTNTVSNGAYRGFGAPQSFFAIETLMNHIAKKIKKSPLELKKKYLVKQGDKTSTNGEYHHHVPLLEMLDKAEEMSHYSEKYETYSKPQKGRYKRGIGMSLFLHGCGFTGAAEKEVIKSVVKLVKSEDDTVEILASNTDIGQGLKTTFSKIVAHILEIPLADVKINNPDTDRVPNSGPTVASRSLMIAGKLLERGAGRMKEKWQTGKSLTIEEHYKHPDMIPWDIDKFQGDAYPTYSYGINVVEVEADTITATTKLLGVWGVFDVGKAIDNTIMKGQAEGGMLQGIGYGSMEKMESRNGKIYQSSMTDYIIPTSKDTVPFEIEFIDNPYDGGPFGAKGAGELTLIGTAPAYEAAVEEAVSEDLYEIPVTPENLMKLL